MHILSISGCLGNTTLTYCFKRECINLQYRFAPLELFHGNAEDLSPSSELLEFCFGDFWRLILLYLYPQSWRGLSTPCSLSSARSSRSSLWRLWKWEARRLLCLKNSLQLRMHWDSYKGSPSTTNPWWVTCLGGSLFSGLSHVCVLLKEVEDIYSGLIKLKEIHFAWRFECAPCWWTCENLMNPSQHPIFPFTCFFPVGGLV